MSIAASSCFMAYFAPLPRWLHACASLDVGPWIGARWRHRPSSPSSTSSSCARGSADRLPLRAAPGSHRGRPQPAREARPATRRLHRLRRLPSRVPHGDRHPRGRLPDRVHPLWLLRRRVRGRPRRFERHGPRFWPSTSAASASGAGIAKRVLVSVATSASPSPWSSRVRREGVTFAVSPVYMDEAAIRGDRPGRARTSRVAYLLRAANHGTEPVASTVRVEGLPADTVLGGSRIRAARPRGEKRSPS